VKSIVNGGGDDMATCQWWCKTRMLINNNKFLTLLDVMWHFQEMPGGTLKKFQTFEVKCSLIKALKAPYIINFLDITYTA
jgi:hypothetical protein